MGRLLYDEATARVFILERSAPKGSSVLTEANRIFDTFRTHTGLVPWSVLEFQVRLPDDLQLEKFKFLTGRLTLQFKGKDIALTAERWGLADSIVAKHDLVSWARGLIGDGEVVVMPDGLRVSIKPRVPLARTTEGIVRHDAERNRLLVLKAVHRNRPPQAEWLS